MNEITGNIVTADDVFFGTLEFDHVIKSITKKSEIKEHHPFIYAGFIDLHVHGGGGSDIMEGETSIRNMLLTHAKFGTTSLLATTVTESLEHLKAVFHDIKIVMNQPQAGEADLLGVHLEGPFLSPHKLGAQPDCPRPFSLQEVLELHAIAPIRIITVAPESGITKDNITTLSQHKIVVQLGHSNASYEDATELLHHGVQSVTHLFNAMSGLHHRAPGLVGASLALSQKAELIPDLIHVHPGAIAVALRAIPQLYFVTDATAAAGMPDGDYKLGPHQVHKCANGVRLADGTLAGSSLTMNQALKNACELGLNPNQSTQRLSQIQSQLINQNDRGQIVLGQRADLVIINDKFDVVDVYIKGQNI